RLDPAEFVSFFFGNTTQVVSALQIKPELLGRSKEPRQASCHFWRDSSTFENNVIHRRRTHAQRLGQAMRGDLHGLEELLAQNLPRMNPPCRCTLADSSHEWTPGFLLLIPVRGRAGGLIFPLGQAGGQSRSKAKKKASKANGRLGG